MVLGLTTLTLIGGILLIASILALLFRSQLAISLIRIFPIGNMKMKILAVGIIGLLMGGFAILPAIWGWGTGLVGMAEPAEIVTAEEAAATAKVSCIYKTHPSTETETNCTLRQDPDDTSLIFYDCDESNGGPTEGAGVNNNFTMTCKRSGAIGEDAAIHLVLNADTFRSEVDSSDASDYCVLELKSQGSNIWSGEDQKEGYLTTSAGGSLSTADIEEIDLVFSESQKERDIIVTLEFDNEAFDELKNQTTRYVRIYQRDGTDNEVFTIGMNKIV